MQIPQWIVFIPLIIGALLAMAVVILIVVPAKHGRVREMHPALPGLVVGLAVGALLGAMIGYESGDVLMMITVVGVAGMLIGAGIGATYQMWLR